MAIFVTRYTVLKRPSKKGGYFFTSAGRQLVVKWEMKDFDKVPFRYDDTLEAERECLFFLRKNFPVYDKMNNNLEFVYLVYLGGRAGYRIFPRKMENGKRGHLWKYGTIRKGQSHLD